jgi:hypothetical protein
VNDKERERVISYHLTSFCVRCFSFFSFSPLSNNPGINISTESKHRQSVFINSFQIIPLLIHRISAMKTKTIFHWFPSVRSSFFPNYDDLNRNNNPIKKKEIDDGSSEQKFSECYLFSVWIRRMFACWLIDNTWWCVCVKSYCLSLSSVCEGREIFEMFVVLLRAFTAK